MTRQITVHICAKWRDEIINQQSLGRNFIFYLSYFITKWSMCRLFTFRLLSGPLCRMEFNMTQTILLSLDPVITWTNWSNLRIFYCPWITCIKWSILRKPFLTFVFYLDPVSHRGQHKRTGQKGRHHADDFAFVPYLDPCMTLRHERNGYRRDIFKFISAKKVLVFWFKSQLLSNGSV